MPIPDYQTLMLPLLKLADKYGTMNRKEALQWVMDEFKLTESQQKELLPSGKQPIIQNRVSWAWTYLKKAGLLKSTQRGSVEITDRGKKVLSENPVMINVKYLKKFPEFLDFQSAYQKDESSVDVETSKGTPEEILESAYYQLKNEVLKELLDRVKSSSPEFFEELVVNTIVKMGYGGSLHDAGQAIGKSGDEGIDGIIKEDKLGLDVIYLQAKKWEGNVGRPEIQRFAGALQGKHAKKGILITTSDFAVNAREYIKNIDAKIILINGQQLAELMWEYNVGLSNAALYDVKKLDMEYFGE